ncbi:MAG: hypothetical protein EOP51_25635 [Sphingobacteriales bacterium]|nr:MAG: hypothetical protein EOP51_25635 [Sphingobacteriales bacterium]
MSFNGSEGGPICLDDAAALTDKYRSLNPNSTNGHFMGRDILLRLLDQPGCMGIRTYYGIDADGKKQIVMVGADENEADMLDLIADMSQPCPHRCRDSRLNTSA